MTLGPRTLKALSAAGTVAACAVSGVVVAVDQKPAGAPLRPSVNAARAGHPASLVIPPSCTRASARHARKGSPQRCAPASTSPGGTPVAPSVVSAQPGTQPLVSSYVS